ncbi:MAG: radical SAM protein [Candidatus Woesearchaeota archaeon]
MEQIILILTYNCNLNCKYCPTKKTNNKITLDIANKAIRIIKPTNIKFFGGEPLLEWELIKKIVQNYKCKYELTTNGILLNTNKIRFMIRNNFEIRVSIDGDDNSQKKNREIISKNIIRKILPFKENIILNMVIAANQVTEFTNNFNYLTKKGFRNFNLLPAFYTKWNKKEINELKNQLNLVTQIIKDNSKIYIRNKDINKKNYLFNDGYVIDTDGGIYNTNKIMINPFYSKKNEYKIANIKKIDDIKTIKIDANKIKQKTKFDKINLELDNIITKFVNDL